MSHPIYYFEDIKEYISHLLARIDVESIVNIMNNQNELIHTGVRILIGELKAYIQNRRKYAIIIDCNALVDEKFI